MVGSKDVKNRGDREREEGRQNKGNRGMKKKGAGLLERTKDWGRECKVGGHEGQGRLKRMSKE